MNNKINIENKKFFIQISNENIKLKGPIRRIYKIIGFFIAIVIIGFFISNIDLSFSKFGLKIFWKNIYNFFKFKTKSSYFEGQNLFILSIKLLWNSFKLVFVGTFLGSTCAFFTAYFGNSKINKIYIYLPIKIIANIFRIFPEIAFIYFFNSSFDKLLALLLIYWWFTWIWLHEYFSQILENQNITQNYQLIKNSDNKFKAFILYIWPNFNKQFINYTFYALESNLKWTTILSSLGFIGIGTILTSPLINQKYFSELLIPLLIMTMFSLFIHLVKNIWIKTLTIGNISKKRLSKKENLEKNDNYFEAEIKHFYNWKTIKNTVKILLILLSISIIIFSLTQLKGQKFYYSKNNEFFNAIWKPNWNVFGRNTVNEIIEFVSLVTITLIIILFISYLKTYFLTNSIIKNNGFFQIWNTIFRFLPTITLFLFISPIFNSPQISFLISFVIHSSSILSNNLSKSTNKIENQKIENLRKQNWSKAKIYNKYIIPSVKKDLTTMMLFESEKNIKRYITYGIFTASLLGSNSYISRGKEASDTTPYIWIGIFILIIANLTSNFIRKKLRTLS